MFLENYLEWKNTKDHEIAINIYTYMLGIANSFMEMQENPQTFKGLKKIPQNERSKTHWSDVKYALICFDR